MESQKLWRAGDVQLDEGGPKLRYLRACLLPEDVLSERISVVMGG